MTILHRPSSGSINPRRWLRSTHWRCLIIFLLPTVFITFPTTILLCSAQPSSPLVSSSSSPSIPMPQQRQQLTHPQHPSRCIAADSYHTYICTENSEATRRALQLFASSGGGGGDGNINDNTMDYNSATITTTISQHNFIDIGVEQRITGSDTEQTNIRMMIKKMYVYLEEEVYSRSEYEIVRENGKCINHHELCAFWSSVGECETNRGFMMENCVAACRLCLLASVNLMA